jgi:hypothetical protein
MKDEMKTKPADKPEKFTEGADYFFENGMMILTKNFLLKRGYCCKNGCRNCPYLVEKNVKLQ